MPPLSLFPLPLQSNGPPAGYGWEDRDMSALSTTTAFNTGINQRDKFLGKSRCIICGTSRSVTLEHCHIIMDSQPEVCIDLKARGWIPSQAKSSPSHEPRNGLLMCKNHHSSFDAYDFFIRFFPDIRKFVFINYSGEAELQQFHGKAVALDIGDCYVPFPSLFIIHEMRVRGFHPFAPVVQTVPNDISWQEWILLDNIFDNTSGSFKRDLPPRDSNNIASGQGQPHPSMPPTTSTGNPSSGGRTLALNADVIADILAATRAMPSWKACEMEGTSWTGTGEENIKKYISSIGVQD